MFRRSIRSPAAGPTYVIDIKRIVNDREGVENALRKRVADVDLSPVIDWYAERNALQTSLDGKRGQRKKLSAEIGKMMKQGQDASDTKSLVKALGNEIDQEEAALRDLGQRIEDFLVYLPNVPEEEVPAGGKENNEPLEHRGTKPELGFEARDHVELATSLGLVDYERGTRVGGSGKWAYSGDGALLEWALLNYFVDHHRRNGFRFVLPPHLLRVETGFVAGQFPKFADDVFYVGSRTEAPEDHTHFLLPTAETALAGLYGDEIIPEEELPIELFAYTPCYRREAGSYRTNERGTIRGNQFNKVEIFAITKPDESQAEFEKILGSAMALMDGLGLHYRVVRLAAEDCSESMAKTYDLEVWLPSIGDYKEVSSVSNAHTFQALRGRIRFKASGKGGTQPVHTLNGSGLATSRVFPAVLEQGQMADGRVKVPEPLRAYLGKDFLEPV
ncbi:MAG: serine--tRNA ligase [Myxococcota bacterium]|nr:serine--tRNA ligase [Myxococcota bacterium]